MNKFNGVGRLGHDVDLRYTTEGLAVAHFSIAISRPNNKDNKTDWIDCVSFGKQAEAIHKYFKKGSLIGVTGRIQVDSYEKDGVKRRKWEVYLDKADGFTFCESKPKEEQIQGFKSADEDIPF